MTKYKLNNTLRTASEVTLTSFMTGSVDSKEVDSKEVDSNQNSGAGRPCECQFMQDPGRLAAQLSKSECFVGLNELKVENLAVEKDSEVCLCEKYKGGCKLCPRPALERTLDGKESCLSCHPSVYTLPYTNGIPNNGLPPSYYNNTSSSPGSAGARWRSGAARRARSCCSKKMLQRRLPITDWLPKYTIRSGISDIIAGITVGLTVIPQAIAYAGVAGLPPQYGLYSSFMGCIVYTFFGSVKDSAIGPTAIAAILTRENLHGLGPEFAVLLAFLSGCVELAMGILQLGFLIDFISGPVSVGFTSAAAIIIATTQIKDILGLSFPGGKFIQVWIGLYEHIGETRLWDSVLGVSCIVLLLLLRKVKDIKVSSSADDEKPRHRLLSQALWFLSTTRNILVVLLSSALAYYFDTKGQTPFVLTGDVKPGLPEFSLPPFSATVGNHTYNFIEMSTTLGSAIFVVPLLSILENIALAKVFCEGRTVDATQEMIALGVCNVASSLAHSMPVSGALSRGAVNHAAGVATPAGGLCAAALVLLALQYLTPYFYFIPKSSLAAVIIAAVVFMMELHVFKPIWRTKKLDVVPALATLVSCLCLRLELGIVVGVATNLLFLLYASARPRVKLTHHISSSGVQFVVCAVDRGLQFPAASHLRRALRRAPPLPLVLDATHVPAADFTAAEGIKSVIEEFHGRGQAVIFYNARASLVAVLRGVRPRPLLLARDRRQLDQLLQTLHDH